MRRRDETSGQAATHEPWPGDALLGEPTQYRAGHRLFTQGSPVRTLYLVAGSGVRLTVAKPGGPDVTLGIRRQGWLLGAAAAVLETGYLASAETTDGCVLRTLSLADFRQLNSTSIAVAQWVQRALALDVREHAEAMATFGGRASERLAWYFVELARTAMIVRPDGSLFLSDTPTHEIIGQAIGVSREYASRLIGGFQTDGLIRCEKGRYIIPRGSRLFDLV